MTHGHDAVALRGVEQTPACSFPGGVVFELDPFEPAQGVPHMGLVIDGQSPPAARVDVRERAIGQLRPLLALSFAITLTIPRRPTRGGPGGSGASVSERNPRGRGSGGSEASVSERSPRGKRAGTQPVRAWLAQVEVAEVRGCRRRRASHRPRIVRTARRSRRSPVSRARIRVRGSCVGSAGPHRRTRRVGNQAWRQCRSLAASPHRPTG